MERSRLDHLIGSATTRAEVVELLQLMSKDCEQNPQVWAHLTLSGFLDSLAAVVEADFLGIDQDAWELGPETWTAMSFFLGAAITYE